MASFTLSVSGSSDGFSTGWGADDLLVARFFVLEEVVRLFDDFLLFRFLEEDFFLTVCDVRVFERLRFAAKASSAAVKATDATIATIRQYIYLLNLIFYTKIRPQCRDKIQNYQKST